MPRDKTANHIKLMAAAKEEFLAHGYEKASMRSIGERCGLTAAAIYRHCRNKEDLFDQLVSPAVDQLKDWQVDHVRRYSDTLQSGKRVQWQDSWIDLFREVIYPQMDEYRLLAAKSQGTKYSSFLHDFTEEKQAGVLKFLQFRQFLRPQLQQRLKQRRGQFRRRVPQQRRGRRAPHLIIL